MEYLTAPGSLDIAHANVLVLVSILTVRSRATAVSTVGVRKNSEKEGLLLQ